MLRYACIATLLAAGARAQEIAALAEPNLRGLAELEGSVPRELGVTFTQDPATFITTFTYASASACNDDPVSITVESIQGYTGSSSVSTCTSAREISCGDAIYPQLVRASGSEGDGEHEARAAFPANSYSAVTRMCGVHTTAEEFPASVQYKRVTSSCDSSAWSATQSKVVGYSATDCSTSNRELHICLANHAVRRVRYADDSCQSASQSTMLGTNGGCNTSGASISYHCTMSAALAEAGIPESAPTATPSQAPTSAPVVMPSAAPTSSPSASPSTPPTKAPTSTPSMHPTSSPTSPSSTAPTSGPSPVTLGLQSEDRDESDGSSEDCFSAVSTVQVEHDAEPRRIKDLHIGDRILTASAIGELSFSDVVFLPHATNVVLATFLDIRTSITGSSPLTVTPAHFVASADCATGAPAGLIRADAVRAGQTCLLTTEGSTQVVSVKKVTRAGVYTVVTENELLVVDGVVASPFAHSHAVAHAYYDLHRAVHKLAPELLRAVSDSVRLMQKLVLAPAAVFGAKAIFPSTKV